MCTIEIDVINYYLYTLIFNSTDHFSIQWPRGYYVFCFSRYCTLNLRFFGLQFVHISHFTMTQKKGAYLPKFTLYTLCIIWLKFMVSPEITSIYRYAVIGNQIIFKKKHQTKKILKYNKLN